MESDKYVPRRGSLLLYLKYLLRYVKQVIVKVNYIRLLVSHNLLRKPFETYRFGEHSIRMRKIKAKKRVRLYYLLHPNFHLKIFAHYIYFSSNSFFKCYFGKLIVMNFFRFHFKYCGIVPSFILYPPSHRLKIDVAAQNQVKFDCLITHSVIDSGKIISYQVKNINSATSITMIKLLTSGARLYA